MKYESTQNFKRGKISYTTPIITRILKSIVRSMMLDWPTRQGSKPATTALNQAIYKAAAAALRAEQPEATAAVLAALDRSASSSTRWRSEYIAVVEQLVRLQAAASAPALIQSCRAGLEFATQSFVFRDIGTDSESTFSIADAFATSTPPMLETVTIQGSKKLPTATTDVPFPLASPHGTDTDPIWIRGDDAVAQIHTWRDYGVMEPSAADHAAATCTAPDATPLVRGQTFCLLGVTSEMGPARHLLSIPGAHVLGVARAGPKLEALQKWFRIHGPVGTTLQCAAADLLTDDILAVEQWILATAPPDQPLVLLPLAYMDGEANVRVTVAMDAIVTHVLQHHPSPVSLVYLTSPTTIYTIPSEAALNAQGRYLYQAQNWRHQMLSVVSLGQWLQPANTWQQIDEQDTPIVFNGAYHLQGPNYLLAKLLQQWRCLVAAADGVPVHAPHAPGTRTESVRHNPAAAVALEGLQCIPPLLTFDVGPCSSLMTAIVLHQLATSRESATKPARHPMALFWDGAVHGGGWRCPYRLDSIVAWTFVLGKTWAEPGWCPPAALAPILSSIRTGNDREED
jgi:hypothetical protein